MIHLILTRLGGGFNENVSLSEKGMEAV